MLYYNHSQEQRTKVHLLKLSSLSPFLHTSRSLVQGRVLRLNYFIKIIPHRLVNEPSDLDNLSLRLSFELILDNVSFTIKTNHHQMSGLSKVIYRFVVTLVKITTKVFVGVDKIVLKSVSWN